MARQQPLISSLFGMNRQQIQQQRIQEDAQLGQEFASYFRDPNQRAEAAIGARLGGGLVRAGAKLFGFEDPLVARNQKMQNIFAQTTQELGQGANDPTVLFPALQGKLAEAGFGQEAFEVGQEGRRQMQQFAQQQADIEYKQSAGQYQQQLVAANKQKVQLDKMAQWGSIAFGGLNALNAVVDGDEGIQTSVWNRAMDNLESSGKDVSAIKDLPASERKGALETIVDSATTEGGRVRNDINTLKLQTQLAQQNQKNLFQQQRLELQNQLFQHRQVVDNQKLSQAERKLAEVRGNSLEHKLEMLEIKETNKDQRAEMSKIGTREFNKPVKAYLKDEVGLDGGALNSAVGILNNLYGAKLREKDETGRPKYSTFEAMNLAKKQLDTMVAEEAGIFGTPIGKKRTLKSKPKAAPIKLD
jgi:hypothetical protein